MKRKKEEKPANHERWLLSYSDFMTLLMIFFVIMYAMGSTDTTKYKELAQSLNGAMGESMQGGSGDSFVPDGMSGGNAIGIDDLNVMKQKIDKYVGENNLASGVTATVTSKGLVISLNDNILFESGQAELMSTSSKNLLKIGSIIKESSNYIRVEGHTDNMPIHNNSYKSNWELSSARATNVVRALIDNSYVSPERICAVGYGEYRPVSSNKDEEGRNKNRRVDIVLVDEKYTTLEK